MKPKPNSADPAPATPGQPTPGQPIAGQPIPVGGAASKEGPAAKPKRQESWRETIESIVIAFILAFLFRTFEAEAFVIPTGSMAPTLYGQNRDITCAKCGTQFAVGASTGNAHDAEIVGGAINPDRRLSHAVCPNAACQYINNVIDREIFAGDRILVNKFPYEFGEPQRWDVVVFKFPEEAKTNYIKRLVGLPGEEISIRKGDVWYRKLGSDDPWRIARKSVEKQSALQLLVHDNDHPARDLLDKGWPESWAGEPESGWQGDGLQRTFRIDSKGSDRERWQWLRYTHYLPDSKAWNALLRDEEPRNPTPQLIKDVYGYNMRITAENAAPATKRRQLPDLGYSETAIYWVSDLTLTCELHPESAQGEVLLELVEGVRKYRCRFDLTSGEGQLYHPSELGRGAGGSEEEDVVLLGAPFESGLTPGAGHTVSFTDVDDRLVVWVDGKVRQVLELETDPDARYQAISPTDREDTPADRSPVGIAVRGASIRVGKLLIQRDIHYTDDNHQRMSDAKFKLQDFEEDGLDQFLMLGDNSPRSNDSRLWRESHAVPRRLLIGKAFCIYWPHGVPFLNQGRGYPMLNYHERWNHEAPTIPKFSLPFVPQVGRMRRIW